MKFKDILVVTGACVIALAFGMLMTLPLIIKMNLSFTLIDFLNRN